jgi:hypothetical protein
MERDVQLLANRITLLKQEEIKTQKRIEETRKKCRDIAQKKKQAEERHVNVSHL